MANQTFFLIAAFVSCLLASSYANVIELNSDNFNDYVDGSSNVLVEFFAPWCGHCKNLAPEWKLAAETFLPTDDIKLAAVDATENSKLADKFGVQGYPTIKFFPKGSTEPKDYDGGRTADTIVKWVNDKVGTNRKIKVAPSSVVALTSETFDSLVLGSKAALVEFYAPWCGHCKQLAPKYEKVGNIFAADPEVLVAKVDATEESELGNKYEIRGYPTIKFFPAGSATPEDYQGGREVEDFVEFLNERAGTQRNADGSLKPSAGRLTTLDEVIKAAGFHVDASVQQKLEEASKGLNEAAAKIYNAVAKNIVAKGKDYVNTESARVAKLLAGGNLKPESKKNFQLRQNILKAFSAATSSDEL